MKQQAPGQLFSDLDAWLDEFVFHVVPTWLWVLLFAAALAAFVGWRRRVARRDEEMREMIRMGARKTITKGKSGSAQKQGHWEMTRED